MTENIHNTGPSAQTAQGWMNSLTEFAIRATQVEIRAAFLTLALAAREQEPQARFITLGVSDQGPWLWAMDILNAERNVLSEEWDDMGAAFHIYTGAALEDAMGEFLVENSEHTYLLDIDLVLKHIHPHPVLEILHSRDSDGPCSMDVWVAGESYTYGRVVDIDPGRGWEEAAWDAMVEGELSLPASEKFRGAVQATFDDNGDSEFIDGEEDDDS